MSKDKEFTPLAILAERVDGYKCCPVTGFGVASTSDGQIMVEPYFDLPPLPADFNNPDENTTICRKIWSCYDLNQTQAQTLIEMLHNAMRQMREMNEKNR